MHRGPLCCAFGSPEPTPDLDCLFCMVLNRRRIYSVPFARSPHPDPTPHGLDSPPSRDFAFALCAPCPSQHTQFRCNRPEGGASRSTLVPGRLGGHDELWLWLGSWHQSAWPSGFPLQVARSPAKVHGVDKIDRSVACDRVSTRTAPPAGSLLKARCCYPAP